MKPRPLPRRSAICEHLSAILDNQIFGNAVPALWECGDFSPLSVSDKVEYAAQRRRLSLTALMRSRIDTGCEKLVERFDCSVETRPMHHLTVAFSDSRIECGESVSRKAFVVPTFALLPASMGDPRKVVFST